MRRIAEFLLVFFCSVPSLHDASFSLCQHISIQQSILWYLVASLRHLFVAIKLWKTLLKIIITVARKKYVKWEEKQKNTQKCAARVGNGSVDLWHKLCVLSVFMRVYFIISLHCREIFSTWSSNENSINTV